MLLDVPSVITPFWVGTPVAPGARKSWPVEPVNPGSVPLKLNSIVPLPRPITLPVLSRVYRSMPRWRRSIAEIHLHAPAAVEPENTPTLACPAADETWFALNVLATPLSP